jgi:hypothetical protein
MIWTARPRPLIPAPMIRTSVSNDILKFTNSTMKFGIEKEKYYAAQRQKSQNSFIDLQIDYLYSLYLAPHCPAVLHILIQQWVSHYTMHVLAILSYFVGCELVVLDHTKAGVPSGIARPEPISAS